MSVWQDGLTAAADGLVALVLLSIVACHPVPPPAPLPDASDASALGDAPLDDCQRGCAALAAVGCPLGDAGTDCAGFLRVLNGGKEPNPVTHKPLMCSDVAAIQTKADVLRLRFACP